MYRLCCLQLHSLPLYRRSLSLSLSCQLCCTINLFSFISVPSEFGARSKENWLRAILGGARARGCHALGGAWSTLSLPPPSLDLGAEDLVQESTGLDTPAVSAAAFSAGALTAANSASAAAFASVAACDPSGTHTTAGSHAFAGAAVCEWERESDRVSA